MKNSTPSAQPPLTLEALLKLHDEAFVTIAYKAILGRSADPEGLENYLRQVRTGVEKSRIVAELASSPEGKLRSADFPGLRDMMAAHGKDASSFWTRVFGRSPSTAMETIERQLRIIDNRLSMVEQCAAEQNRQIAALLILLTQLPTEPGDSNSRANASDVNVINSAAPPSILPLNVRKTFADLKAAIAMKQRE
jgi:Domain of unknown function (DUF4214)